MVAREPKGPRGTSGLTAGQRDAYSNLLLLCNVHHKLVDDNPVTYSVDALAEMKVQHEDWVRNSLEGYDEIQQRDDERYAGYIDEWEAGADLDCWQAWTSHLLWGGQPKLSFDRVRALEELARWTLGRVWPTSRPAIGEGLTNFRLVAGDLVSVLRDTGAELGSSGDRLIQVEKRYKRIEGWEPQRYRQLAREFNFNVALVEDLALELTRAANLVCDIVRDELIPDYRVREGRLLVTSGPYDDMSARTSVVMYSSGTSPNAAYPGLHRFMIERAERDLNFGEGDDWDTSAYD